MSTHAERDRWEALAAELAGRTDLTVWSVDIGEGVGLDTAPEEVRELLGQASELATFFAQVGGAQLRWGSPTEVGAEAVLFAPHDWRPGVEYVFDFGDDPELIDSLEGTVQIYASERSAVMYAPSTGKMMYCFDDEPAVELELDFTGFVQALRRFRGIQHWPTLFSARTATMVEADYWIQACGLFPDLLPRYPAELARVGVHPL